jgi:hypothetical protein
MLTCQSVLEIDAFDAGNLRAVIDLQPDLAFAFGAPAFFARPDRVDALRAAMGNIPWIGCSTAGEIFHRGVCENTLVVTGVRFSGDVTCRIVHADCPDMAASRGAGRALAGQLPGDGLVGVFLLTPGVNINGSEVIAGAREALPMGTRLSGGLAGDGDAFVRTWTAVNGMVSSTRLVAVGFYGPTLRFLTGSYGGWQAFGPLRTVTRSSGNVLHEMDGEPALALYRRYLGDYASGLPGTGLLFPLAIPDHHDGNRPLIRTLIGIDEASGSLTFAGDVPEGATVRLMQASVNSLVDGAQAAAETAISMNANVGAGLALLVSCVGRKLVMAGRTEEEVEAVADAFGQRATVAGFYSYGEISPGATGVDCHLHNQTMTVTFIADE